MTTIQSVPTKTLENSKINEKRDTFEAAKKFEEFFFTQVLKHMDPETKESSFLGKGAYGEMLKSFWYEALARSCASQGLGITEKISPRDSELHLNKGLAYDNVF
jgi:Rod binding domain-containing protein